MRPIVVAFVVQSCLSLTSTVHSVQNNKPAAQQFSSGIKKLPDIYWNTTNPIFRIDNTDNIIDVNRGRSFHEYDQVNILCPLYNKNVTPNESETERFIIYHVNRDEYDMCNVMRARPHVIAHCNKPYIPTFFTISFRSFSPTPGALEFHAGQDYYFISTSSKENIYQKAGGMCRTHNMKIVFKVADADSAPVPTKTNPAENVNKVDVDNQDIAELDKASDKIKDLINEKKERRRRRKKNRNKNKQHEELNNSMTPPQGSELSHGDYQDPEGTKWRPKESGYVERVNNLMKQEASIGGGFGGINNARSVHFNMHSVSIGLIVGWLLLVHHR